MVVNPADVPTKSKERRKKTDRIDSGKLCNRMPGNKAIIWISKKSLNRIRYVWKAQQPYQFEVVK